MFIKSSKVTGTQLALGAALQSFHSCDEQMEHVLAHAADTIHNSRSEHFTALRRELSFIVDFFFFLNSSFTEKKKIIRITFSVRRL